MFYAFKGAQQATRYEVAAMVARAVARGDELHASKKDVELLKKLCAEFKNELDALGAKTDKLDKRVTKLEKGIGSWNISGRFRFNANFTGGDQKNGQSTWTQKHGKNTISRDTARMFFRRQITADTYFDSQFRLGSAWAGVSDHPGMNDEASFSVRKFYVGTKLPFWGLGVKIGRWQFDWESDYALANDEDSFFGDWRVDGFWFEKKWNTVKLDAIFGRNTSGSRRNHLYAGIDEDGALEAAHGGKYEHTLYGVNLKWTPTDKLTLGAMGYWQQGDGAVASEKGTSRGNVQTYGVTAGYKFTDGIALKGIYYWQHMSSAFNDVLDEVGAIDKNNYAFKVILDVKQNVLKFTDLWVEYNQYKNGFGANNGAAGYGTGVNCYAMGSSAPEVGVQWARPINNESTKIFFIKAEQKWNKKWSTFVRATIANFGTDDYDNAKEWGLGVKYKLNPAITFMLAYDRVDYGEKRDGAICVSGDGFAKGIDQVIMFQTDVKF